MPRYNPCATFALILFASPILSGQASAGSINTSIGIANIPPRIYNIFNKEDAGRYLLDFTVNDNNTVDDIDSIRVELKYDQPPGSYLFIYWGGNRTWTANPQGGLVNATRPDKADLMSGSFNVSLSYAVDAKIIQNSKNMSFNITVTDKGMNWQSVVFQWTPTQQPGGGGGKKGGTVTRGTLIQSPTTIEVTSPPATTATPTTSPPAATITSTTRRVAATVTTQATTAATTPKALFDILLSIPDDSKALEQGKNLSAKVSLFNLGRPGKTDVTLKYQITDSHGTVVLEDEDTMIIETQSSFLRTFDVNRLGPGDYTLRATLLYENATATASASSMFKITGSLEKTAGGPEGLNMPQYYLVLPAVVLLMTITLLLWRKKRSSFRERVHEIIKRRSK